MQKFSQQQATEQHATHQQLVSTKKSQTNIIHIFVNKTKYLAVQPLTNFWQKAYFARFPQKYVCWRFEHTHQKYKLQLLHSVQP